MVVSPSVFSEQQREALVAERQLAQALAACLQGFQSSAEDTATLQNAIRSLDEPFLLVVAGEFNAGKSAFINALLGETVAPEGVTPTTAVVTLLRYAETPTRHMRADGIEEAFSPAAFLRDVAIVDTPGTNAVLRRHEQLTTEFIPRSDFILFVTSADRPFTESERLFLERIRTWGKKVVLIINKVDLLRSKDDVTQVVSFVRRHAADLLGAQPEVFPLSARLAQEARQASDGPESIRLWETSRLGVLREYLIGALDGEGRARLKLLSPLGVVERLIQVYTAEAMKRQTLLDEDARTIAAIEAQLATHRQEMLAAFEQRLRAIQSIVLEMRDRGHRFFDDTVRLGRLSDLLRGEKIQEAFQREVIANAPEEIAYAVNGLIEWMVEQEQRHWQRINEYLTRRRLSSPSALGQAGEAHDTSLVSDGSGVRGMDGIGATFDFTRRRALQRVAIAADRTLRTYDREAEARRLAESLQGAVAQTAGAGVAAIGVGMGIALIVGTAAADLTGITAAIVLLGVGLGILPLRRRRAKRQFDTRTHELEERLATTLRDQFTHELDADAQRLTGALAPYMQFVRLEQERVAKTRATLERLGHEAEALRQRIQSDEASVAPHC